MLLTHLSGVFSRAVLQEETLTNPILEKIMVQYEEVANAIRKAVERIFQEKIIRRRDRLYGPSFCEFIGTKSERKQYQYCRIFAKWISFY